MVFPQMLLRHLTEDKVPLSSGPEIAGTAFYPQPNNSDTRVTIFFFRFIRQNQVGDKNLSH